MHASLCSYISKTTRPNFTTFSVRVIYGRGSDLLWRQCNKLCTSGFVDNVIFSHNGANGPESTMTRMFRPFHQLAAPEAKSAVSDCMLFRIKIYKFLLLAITIFFTANVFKTTDSLMQYLMALVSEHSVLRCHAYSWLKQCDFRFVAIMILIVKDLTIWRLINR